MFSLKHKHPLEGMSVDEQIRKGSGAERILSDELVREVFDQMESDFLKAFADSPARDMDGREKIYLSLKLLQKLRNDIERWANVAKVARKQLENDDKLRKRAA